MSQDVGTDGLLDRRSYHSDAVTSAYYEDIERWLDAIEEHRAAPWESVSLLMQRLLITERRSLNGASIGAVWAAHQASSEVGVRS